MSIFKRVWDRIDAMGDRKLFAGIILVILVLVLFNFLNVLDAWSRKYSIELEATSFQHQEERRKLDLALERDRLVLAKERRDLGLDIPNSQALKDLGEIFLRVGPYALLFYSLAQAWKVFEDQRSSRLRLTLAVSFSVIVVGFVLVVGGYVTPTSLVVGLGEKRITVTSESLGLVVVVIGAVMFLVSLAFLRPRKLNQDNDEA